MQRWQLLPTLRLATFRRRFMSWMERNGRSSAQSSWSANRKKRERKARAATGNGSASASSSARAGRSGPLGGAASQMDARLATFLDQLDPATMAALQNVFGSRLEHLESLEVRAGRRYPQLLLLAALLSRLSWHWC